MRGSSQVNLWDSDVEESLDPSFQARTGCVVLTVVILLAGRVPSPTRGEVRTLGYLLHMLPFHPLNLRLSFLPPCYSFSFHI